MSKLNDFFVLATQKLRAESQLANAWLAGQHYGEAARTMENSLRAFLGPRLPDRYVCATGFAATVNELSRQCDLLIYEASYPALYADAEMRVADASSVRGVIEVKATMKRKYFDEALLNIHSAKSLNNDINGGLFCYLGTTRVESVAKWIEAATTDGIRPSERAAKVTIPTTSLPNYIYFVDKMQVRGALAAGKFTYNYRRFSDKDGWGFADFYYWMLQSCNPDPTAPALEMIRSYVEAEPGADWRHLVDLEV